MKHKLSVIMVTRNAATLLRKSLQSIENIADEIVVVDSGSTDKTLKILKEYGVKTIKVRKNHLGRNKALALKKTENKFILMIDSDEIVSRSLHSTISNLKRTKNLADGYLIPFHNHFLGKRVRFGGENYQMVRLFRKTKAIIIPLSVHEKIDIKSKNIFTLKEPILHYSYRSIWQMFSKFTMYALNDASEKYRNGERSSLKKITLYPAHMFWARYIKDKGYKDGLFRIPLDLGFAYMEWLTYISLFYKIYLR